MPRIARSEPSRARVIIGLAGLAAIGAGAAGALARQHDLGPSLARVQPGLRAPLLVVGRGRTGEPEPPTPEGRPPLLASRIPERVIPRGLGRRAVAASEGREVPVWLYEAPGREQHGTSGALIWIHGGGLIGGTPAQDHDLCTRLAREAGGLVVSVDYRLAPVHRYPAAIDDCGTVLAWVHDRAEDLAAALRRPADETGAPEAPEPASAV